MTDLEKQARPEPRNCEIHRLPMIWNGRIGKFYCHHCLDEAV